MEIDDIVSMMIRNKDGNETAQTFAEVARSGANESMDRVHLHHIWWALQVAHQQTFFTETAKRRIDDLINEVRNQLMKR